MATKKKHKKKHVVPKQSGAFGMPGGKPKRGALKMPSIPRGRAPSPRGGGSMMGGGGYGY